MTEERRGLRGKVKDEMRECLANLDGVDACTPREKPAHIAADCEDCGYPLELVDRDADDPGDIWYDEWECPRCKTGILMDWPEEAFKELAKLAERVKGEL
jgi:hypothetical protein